MAIALIVGALLAPASLQAAPRPPIDSRVNRSLSDTDRLTELRIDIDSALAKREIDQATAARLYLGIERTRRHMIRPGLQSGCRQRVRLRARIAALYASLAESRAQAGADIRSEN